MADSAMPEVGLHLAFSWKCPRCNQHQYVDAVFAEITPDDRDEAITNGEEAPVTGEWVTNPEVVTCAGCGLVCSAVNSGQHAPVDQ